ncbi:ribosomal protection-like ABC-F family protein [Pseudalkalibacillus caeni]|uniref:ABC-F type ribosomal protection protein n=1 Tax=Exobacillus caeni TaxID=2574798 RepID=A0A5R9F9H5_9BACL|nr:ABC-F type ribosomal protection protein [Pseudalkalibacillus caeni]TLS37204.1 ABC-F type ribosomal protection protein [Pseudalkalibacillus caeni]
MNVMRLRGIQKSFVEKQVLKHINLDIKRGDRIGLVGPNGAGKTTLANILYGKIKPDSGSVLSEQQALKIGYLLQSVDYSSNDFESVLSTRAAEGLYEVTSQLGLTGIKNWEGGQLEYLSGGEKLKLALANIWTSNPDMLILDEPTNHLDLKGVEWLVEELKDYNGTVIMISHDRYFLDRTAKQILEIEEGVIQKYTGNYSAYREEKKRRHENQLHRYTEQQKYKAEIESQMANLTNWSDKAHRESTKQDGKKEYYRVKAKKMDNQVKSKRKRLEKELEKHKIEKPKEEAKVRFQFEADGNRGKRIIEARDIRKEYSGRALFENSHFYVKHGERVGIIGDNGCGKTTLIRLLQGDEELTGGELWKSDSLKIAYPSQDVNDLPKDKTVIEALNLSRRDEIHQARTMLANMGLKEDRIRQKIEALSLGERTRIKLAGMMLQQFDVLILDEPTNHLDLPSKEQLEETLDQFTGTILVVSHDRYFIERIADRLLVFEKGKIRRWEMGLREFKEKKQQMKKQPEQKSVEEEQLLIDNKISALMGRLSLYTPDQKEFQEIDEELKGWFEKKRALQ